MDENKLEEKKEPSGPGIKRGFPAKKIISWLLIIIGACISIYMAYELIRLSINPHIPQQSGCFDLPCDVFLDFYFAFYTFSLALGLFLITAGILIIKLKKWTLLAILASLVYWFIFGVLLLKIIGNITSRIILTAPTLIF